MYERRSRLSPKLQGKLIELFGAGSTSRAAGEVTGVNVKTATKFIEDKVTPDSIVHTDTFRACNALDVSDFHHRRINHSQLFADGRNHINGICENLTVSNQRIFTGF